MPKKGKRSHIWQIEKDGDQAYYSQAIQDTGCIRDYHTIDFKDEDPDYQTFEALLSKVESEQAELVRKICNEKRIDSSQIPPLAQFISLLRHRVPACAAHIEKMLQSVVLDSFKIMYRAGRFSEPPEALREAFEKNDIDETLQVRIANWKILSHMFEMALMPESIGLLSQFSYHVHLSEGTNVFVTSDNPVALYHPNYNKIRPYGVGLAMKDVQVTVALSPMILIQAGLHIQTGTSTASLEEVEEFNRRTITMADSYVFTSIVTDDLRQRIGELKDVRAGFVFDSLFYGDGSCQISRFIPVQ
ncbi:MAG: DUF4238 domain-containing protein [Nitrospirales bacterium]|nr:DUF4238 domain-containing protein [Nitrospirales bacterium]